MSDHHLADVWFRATHLDVVSGFGSTVVATDGKEYLDFTAGIAVASTGHCHPAVVAAISEQAGRFIHAQVNCYRHPLLEPLAQRLDSVTPPGIDTFFFTNSGAEATEAAVKLARQTTGRPNVVVFEGSFHGRTAQTMAMTTSKQVYRAGHAPLPSGVFVSSFPAALRWSCSTDEAVERALEDFDRLLRTQTSPEEIAAVVIEPVLGEGGYLPAPTEFLHGLQKRCRDHGMLFVVDEVQSGFGRTGTMFAIDPFDLSPDVIVMAKGIASGFPLAAIGARRDLMARWPVGSHGGTYGGNPMGCAAALATIDILTEPGFLDAVRMRGDQLRSGLRTLAERDDRVRDVRGPGLMVGVEFTDGTVAAEVVARCREDGRVLLMTAGTDGTVVRWMPPLVVTADEVDRGLKAFAEALSA
ncbi:aspartate aminotransferase family protein [Actinospongicola halichondriae]|uniref:aspartate aminotransferase family protein n=1 Tax=Actinospongicola halichondriae TaxID=3236844 RepID=UPI003D525CA3